MMVASTGQIYACGYFGSTFDADPGAGVHNLSSSTYSSNILINYCDLPNPLSAISGPTKVCPGISIEYSVPSVALANSYSWTFSTGVMIDSGGGTNKVKFRFHDSGGTISVYAVGNCGISKSSGLTVKAYPASKLTINAEPGPGICKGDSIKLTAGGMKTYTWTGVTDGKNFAPSQTATYKVSGTDSNACTAEDSVTISVFARPVFTLQPKNIDMDTGSSGQFFYVMADSASSYRWVMDAGSGFDDIADGNRYKGVKDDTLRLVSVQSTMQGYKFRCIVSNGLCTDTSDVVTLHLTNVAGIFAHAQNSIRISPNPVSERLRIEFEKPVRNIPYEILDVTGKTCMQGIIAERSGWIDIASLPAGMYLFRTTAGASRLLKL